MLSTSLFVKGRPEFQAVQHTLPSQPITNIPTELSTPFIQVNKHSLLKRMSVQSEFRPFFVCIIPQATFNLVEYVSCFNAGLKNFCRRLSMLPFLMSTL